MIYMEYKQYLKVFKRADYYAKAFSLMIITLI